ncbi:MAG: tetratricopeptide repeat protein [Candidatus Binatia bacterium]
MTRQRVASGVDRTRTLGPAHGAAALHSVAVLLAAACCVAWLNPSRDRVAEANRLFKHGKFDDAIAKYGEALVDDPDSPLLNFNMGDAKYKAGKYDEALASYARVRSGDADARRAADTAYNLGNTHYRVGAAAETDKPQDALTAYAAALAAYRRTLGANPADRDAKFNYEFVSKKLDDLKKKLEEQQQQQQQQEQQPQADQRQQDRDDRQQQGQNQPPPKSGDQNEEQQQAEAEKSGDEKQAEQQQTTGAQPSDGAQKDELSPQEAASVIDTAKNEELRPDEFARQVQGAAVAEPAQDW